jgi:hypothetical protein
MLNQKCRIFWIFILLLLFPISARAQTAAQAILSPLVTDSFPIILSTLEVFDGEGNFIHNLGQRDVTIIEDNQKTQISALEELETGAQFVVALNLGPTFAIRDVNGISRIERIQGALNNWAASHKSTKDDLSFITNDGSENSHLANAAQWLYGYNAYETNPREAVPSLDVLFRAIELASDPVPQKNMGRTVLLLTPPPDRTGIATLQSITSLAKQERVRIHVWMVSSPAYFSSQGANQLADMAGQTGGKFFAYSGVETIPNVENYLNPLRYVYALSYESKIRNSEPHQVYAQVSSYNQQIISEPQNFEIRVSPPNPIFLSPPIEISRANTAAFAEALSDQVGYTPEEQPLKILIEFPDGRPRPLVRSSLYVDGIVVDENLTPPFDAFTWSLRDYTSSRAHILQVEVLDSLGLSSSSIENKVQINVQQTPQSVISTLRQNAPVIAGAVVASAGGILLLVLIVRGHIHPKTFNPQRKNSSKSRGEREKKKDSIIITESTGSDQTKQRLPKWINRISRPQRESPTDRQIAYLEPFTETRKNPVKETIPISIGEITIGRDSTLSTISINDDALNGLHTRLIVSKIGDYKIFDEDSAAGTWVNYKPISSEGVTLSHGDIIHIGRIGLRFKIIDKTLIPKPIVIHLETNS